MEELREKINIIEKTQSLSSDQQEVLNILKNPFDPSKKDDLVERGLTNLQTMAKVAANATGPGGRVKNSHHDAHAHIMRMRIMKV